MDGRAVEQLFAAFEGGYDESFLIGFLIGSMVIALETEHLGTNLMPRVATVDCGAETRQERLLT